MPLTPSSLSLRVDGIPKKKQPTVGSARADFPFGSPETLFASSQRLLSLPATTRLFSGHHYPSSTESNVCSATVQEQKELNRHLKQGTEQDEFVKLRTERDGGLAEPRLLHQSLQVRPLLSSSSLRDFFPAIARFAILIFFLLLSFFSVFPRQVNIRGGRIPRDRDGKPYLRVPVKVPEGL